MKPKLTLLYLNYEFPPLGGGAGNATYYIAKELAQLGYKITVMTSGYKELPAQEMMDNIFMLSMIVL